MVQLASQKIRTLDFDQGPADGSSELMAHPDLDGEGEGEGDHDLGEGEGEGDGEGDHDLEEGEGEGEGDHDLGDGEGEGDELLLESEGPEKDVIYRASKGQ